MTTTYVLEATNGTNTVTAMTSVSVPGGLTPYPGYASRPTVVSFAAAPSVVAAGGSTVLSWDVANATSVDLLEYGPVSSSGSMNIYPSGTGTITFHLSAQNAYGTTYASCDITVTPPVVPYTPPAWPTVNKFKASDSTVLAGSTVLLSWSVSNADSVYIDNGVGSVPAMGSANVVVWSTTVYTLVATNGANTVAQPVTVTVP